MSDQTVGFVIAGLAVLGALAVLALFFWGAFHVGVKTINHARLFGQFVAFGVWRARKGPHPDVAAHEAVKRDYERLYRLIGYIRERLEGDVENLKMSQPGHVVIWSLEEQSLKVINAHVPKEKA
jgi:hypothetical protein